MSDEQKNRPKILIVDDKPQNLYTLEQLLNQLPVEVVQTTSGAEALKLTLKHDFCLAIVDVQMPEMDGYELVELLRGNRRTQNLPVIFVSAIFSDEYHHRKGYEAGAVDFMSKPFNPDILLSKVRIFLELYYQRLDLQQANAKLSKRAVQLEASTQVGHQATSILEPEPLLAEVVRLIRAKFGYYFVSVWLFDEKREGLVLQASCRGVDNRQVFEPGFTLPLEADQSIVVLVGRRGEFFLAEDVRADSTYLAVVELPDTRSELALPLQVGQEMLGVLDIQSDRLDAFNYEDVAVLQMLANQVAVAIQNARRYAQISRFNQELEDKVRQRTAELQKAYNRLELLDRNKSDFIKVVSHELRTPLTSIKLSAQILPGAKGDAEAATILQTVDQNVNRMYGIVNTMLDITKLDSQLLEKYDTNIVLSQVIAIAANKFQAALTERRLTLTPDDLEKLPPIYADDELLVKVFSHLIGNAIKYTPDGGAITITGFETTTPTGESAVEVVISDTGIGIDRAHHDLIFEKFYQTGEVALHSSGRTKFKGGGPGLGLAIARGIVRAHGGEIWVESEGYNEETCPGSRFHVQLPRGEIQEK